MTSAQTVEGAPPHKAQRTHAITSIVLAGLSVVLLGLHFLLAGIVGLAALIVAVSGVRTDPRYRLVHRIASAVSVLAIVASLSLSLSLVRSASGDVTPSEPQPATRYSG